MPALNYNYLLELEKYLDSGDFKEDFFYSPEERRLEMLSFLEKMMELGDLADDTATKIIFRNRAEEGKG